MYYMYQPNQNYFNGEIPVYGGNPNPQIVYGDYGYNQNYTPQQYNPYQQNNYYNQQPQYLANMGGYYNGGYYNPYAYRQEQEQRERELKHQHETMFNVLKFFVELGQSALGTKLSDEELNQATIKRYYPQEYTMQQVQQLSEEEMRFNRINNENIRQTKLSQYAVPSRNYEVEYINNQIAEIQELYDAEDLFDWMTIVDEQNYIKRQKELEMKLRNVRTLYDPSRYNQMLSMHNNSVAFKQDLNIDDITIELPEHLKNSYTERRAKFIDAIISRMQ